MKLLFSTGSLFYLPLKDIFLITKEAGFDGCDLVIDRHLNEDYLNTIAECVHILPVDSIHAPFTKISSWGAKAQALAKTIEIAKNIGAKVVNFHPPSWYPLELTFFNWFKKVIDFQTQLNCDEISLAIENMPLTGKRLMLASYFLNKYEDLIRFGLERNLYFTLDTTHLATFRDDVVVGFLTYFHTGRLKNIHISDYGNSRSHLFIGRGDLPMAKLLNTIRRLGYDEMVTLELSPYELPKTREWLIKIIRYELSFLKTHLGKDIVYG